MVRDGVGCGACAVLTDLRAVNALESNHVQVEKVALELLGKMAAGENASAGAWALGPLPELLQIPVLGGIVDEPAEGRAEVAVVAGPFPNNVVAPIIEAPPVRVGEAVSEVALELVSARLETINADIHVAHRPGSGFDLGAVKHPVAEVGRAARIEHHRVGGVVRVG